MAWIQNAMQMDWQAAMMQAGQPHSCYIVENDVTCDSVGQVN